MITERDDRADYDSDTYSQSERDDFQAKLDVVDDAKDTLALEIAAAFRKFGQAVYAAEPKFILFFNSSSRQVERGQEAIQGAVEYAQAICADLAGDMIDSEEIARAESIVERGCD